MSKSFAFLRDIPAMERDIALIRADAASFTADNGWANAAELPFLFKNLDILRMSEAVAEAICYTAKAYGSRGSGFVLSGTDFMDRMPIGENTEGRECVVVVNKKNGISIECVPVRPIPAGRDLWFERVWGKFRERTEK
jgi:hypothetical protein